MHGIDTYFLVPFLLSSTFNGPIRVLLLIWSDSYPCTTLTGSSTPHMNRPSKKTLNLKINPNPRRGAENELYMQLGASRQRLSRRKGGCFFRAPARAEGCRGGRGLPAEVIDFRHLKRPGWLPGSNSVDVVSKMWTRARTAKLGCP